MKALVIGGGIGGFSAALCLHKQGIEVEVFEQADGIRELGVGINLLPHAVKELSELGLLERLDTTGIRTKELIYCNRFGQCIWTEPRGPDAGYAWPQFSIHRGELQGLLYQAAAERIGEASIHVSHRLVGLDQGADGVVAEALRAYEAERLPAANQVVLSNRKMGPERVLDIVAERAPTGFERLDDVISHRELLGIAMQYRKVAGFERERLADPNG
jgi:flavin-dependent dehydrogenase